MPKMKDSGVRWIGNIPYKWSINRLKYNIECFDGKRIPIDASLRVEGPYPYWGAGNITDYVDDYIFNEELVLLGEDGAPFFDEYRPVAFLVNEPIWVNNHIHVLRGNKNILNKFLTYFLNIVQYDVYINGSIINKLTKGNMNNINIVIPSIEEQRLITTFLDDKVGKTEEILKDLSSQIDILNKYKKSLITEIVTKGVNPNVELKDSGVDWIGKIPKKWKISKLKYMVEIKDGTHDTPDYTEAAEDTVPLITGRFLDYNQNKILYDEANHISYCDYKKINIRSNVEYNDIIMPMIGTIGNPVIVKEQRPFSIKNLALFKTSHDEVLAKYLYYQLNSNIIDEQFNILIRGGVQSFVSLNIIENLLAINIEKKIQQEIVNYLDNKCRQIDTIILDKQMQIEKMEKYKKSLIYEYVTGKKRVKGAEELYG